MSNFKIAIFIFTVLFSFAFTQSNSNKKFDDISYATNEYVTNAVKKHISDTFAPNLLLEVSDIFNTKYSTVAKVELFQNPNQRKVLDTTSKFEYNKYTGEVTGEIKFQTDMYEIYAVDEEPLSLDRTLEIIAETNHKRTIDLSDVWYTEVYYGYTRILGVPFSRKDNVYELVWDVSYNNRKFIIGKYTEEIYYNGIDKY
ncbi:hypothetical protein PIROE2DRAFT_5417 [Piromyces sp. E2]|nr:hypothetical protein PIROE2DRAFT_5417 [Piromyces sp. E2]|eukprot:OUM67155.1 hypothetical protein PIROE2DRAFT_5417 [Piromyces sp. E2]